MSAIAMPARKRCAVYTRKSTEEGLEQEYNSIDAQRDAGQAFIVSQRAEGWIFAGDDYDDPAFSGGNMERPALRRLLADIEKGLVEVVVVYKIDRLTRSLADFSKIIIDKKHLHKMLRNRIYLGEISHKGSWYPGQHEPIVDPGLWRRVHEILSEDAHERAGATQIRKRTDALLRGLLYAPGGERMYPTFTRKNGRQYRYYASKSELRFGAAARTCGCIPAEEVEAVVIAQIKTVLGSPEAIAAVCRVIEHQDARLDEAQVVLSMSRLGDVWERLFPVERHRIVNLMIERVDLVPGGLKIKWRALGWKALIGEFAPETLGAELAELEETT